MYRLKPFYPIIKSGDYLFIGIPGTRNYLEVLVTPKDYKFFNILINRGITTKDLKKSSLFTNLLSKEMLYEDSKISFSTNRNELFFQYINSTKLTDNILNTPILIIGAGAGGSTITYLLAQFGYKNISICDDDKVEKTDLQKSVVFNKNDIGKYKVTSIKNRLKSDFNIKLNIAIKKVLTKKDIKNLFDKTRPKLVIKACDPNFSFRLILNSMCYKHNIPFIHMSYFMETINIGPLFVPGNTYCDLINNLNTVEKYGSKYDFYKMKKVFKEKIIHPSVLFNINILSSFILKEITCFLMNDINHTLTLGSIVYLNTMNLNYTHYKIENNINCDFPNCNTCKKI